MIDKEINKNYIKSISIQGFRGFKENQKIEFSYPEDENSSGLNIIVGQNCSGKSTILEAIMLLMNTNVSGYFLSKTMRNSEIELKIEMENIKCNTILKTNSERNYAEMNFESNLNENSDWNNQIKNYFLVPSRKNINNNNLYNNNNSIENFLYNYNINTNQTINRRQNNMNNEFVSVLTAIYANQVKKKKFDEIIHKFLDEISWNLYMSDEQPNSFIVDIVDKCGETHFEGVGDGMITVIYIAIGLFLLEENLVNVLLIDEPEVSLHTEVIKTIGEVLKEYAQKYQIIISTHSPYLINWEAIKSGGKLIRTINNEKIITYELDNSIIKDLSINPSNNPHIYGTTSKEVFFLKDKIILVEGQEDVVCYKKIIKRLNLNKEYNFYGWGAGGANNIVNIMKILKSLGYKKVVAIFDGDDTGKKGAIDCTECINDDDTYYKIINIDEEDVRDKYVTIYDDKTLEKKDDVLLKSGVCDKYYKIKSNFDKDYRDEMNKLFKEIDDYFES